MHSSSKYKPYKRQVFKDNPSCKVKETRKSTSSALRRTFRDSLRKLNLDEDIDLLIHTKPYHWFH